MGPGGAVVDQQVGACHEPRHAGALAGPHEPAGLDCKGTGRLPYAHCMCFGKGGRGFRRWGKVDTVMSAGQHSLCACCRQGWGWGAGEGV